MDTVWEQAGHERAADQSPPWLRKMPLTTISRRPRPPAWELGAWVGNTPGGVSG